jgi:antitoxin component of MazEF toxin-antitoxin module
MEIEQIPIVEKRRLVASGSSVVLVVPKQWLSENSLKAGDDVLMVANGDLTYKKMTKENVDRIKNQLSHHNQTSSVATDGEKSADS